MAIGQDTTPEDFRLMSQPLPLDGKSNAAARRRYRAAHPERCDASTKAWREANPDAVKAQKKRNYEKHRETKVASQKAYYEANREVVSAKARTARQAERAADPEAYRAREAARCRLDREKHAEKRRAKAFEAALRRKYRLTHAEFLVIQQSQDGRCAICRSSFGPLGVNKPCVDHDHAEGGKVRGILCRLCNAMIGQALDNPKILRAAARYLELAAKSAV